MSEKRFFIAPSDPDAGDQLIAYLLRVEHRVSLNDVFDLFSAKKDPVKKTKVFGLLTDLIIAERLVEVERHLYCLPKLRFPVLAVVDVSVLRRSIGNKEALRLKPLCRDSPKDDD
ncbi:MAG: hypothetical protein WC866_00345 [Patescibacteria group bacterium]|jgi:hypothetical protein